MKLVSKETGQNLKEQNSWVCAASVANTAPAAERYMKQNPSKSIKELSILN